MCCALFNRAHPFWHPKQEQEPLLSIFLKLPASHLFDEVSRSGNLKDNAVHFHQQSETKSFQSKGKYYFLAVFALTLPLFDFTSSEMDLAADILASPLRY